MKYFIRTTLFIIVTTFLFYRCSDEDTGGGSELDNFLIVTNINSGTTPVAYVGTFHDLSVGSYTNSKARQTTTYPFVSIFNNEVYVLQNRSGDLITKYKRDPGGTLSEIASVTMPAASSPYCMVFENSSKAYVSLFNTGKIAVVDPSSMTITDFIDLTSYAIGDGSPDPSVITYKNGKLYVACAQTSDYYSSSRPAQVLIIDVANGNTITSATDNRATYAGNTDTPTSLFFTENGDFYIYCVSSWGYVPGQKAGFLRIKSGETNFDPTYFFNTSDYAVPDVPDNHIDYLQHPIYTGNGIVYSAGNVPSLASNPPDHVNDRTFGAFKVDIVNQSITKLNIPYSNGYSASVLPIDDKVLYGMSTNTGVGIYMYDIATNTTSPEPVITTQGDPGVLRKFE